jgi:hypothetical protein
MYTIFGLAEIVRKPSPLTKKYLDIWFTGAGAFGSGLSKLGWPVVTDSTSLLVIDNDQNLKMDLKAEYKVMYSQTIFHYKKTDRDYSLVVDKKKLLSPRHLLGTLKALWSQSKLLVNPQKTFDDAKKLAESIPITPPNTLQEIEKGLEDTVWPNLVAVDYMGEFLYAAHTSNYSDKQKLDFLTKMQNANKDRDWYTKSMLAWGKYIDKEITAQQLCKDFGFAAGDAYELTKPRYFELAKQSKPLVTSLPIKDIKVQNEEDLVIAVQYLRSETKRRSLIWISALRDQLKPNE